MADEQKGTEQTGWDEISRVGRFTKLTSGEELVGALIGREPNHDPKYEQGYIVKTKLGVTCLPGHYGLAPLDTCPAGSAVRIMCVMSPKAQGGVYRYRVWTNSARRMKAEDVAAAMAEWVKQDGSKRDEDDGLPF